MLGQDKAPVIATTLSTRFREFYVALIQIEKAAAEDSEHETMETLTASVSARVKEILANHAFPAAGCVTEQAREQQRQAQYAMAALADEIFLHRCRWKHPGAREWWRKNLLEQLLFATYEAGDEIFARINGLLQCGGHADQEIVLIYLNMLSLGFEGKFRGDEESAFEIAKLKRQLYQLLFNRSPDLANPSRVVSPQAYLYTLEGWKSRRLPYLRPWIVFIVIFLIGYLGVSHVLWRKATDSLHQELYELNADFVAAAEGH